jgi:hypothetical protein
MKDDLDEPGHPDSVQKPGENGKYDSQPYALQYLGR